MWSYWLVVYDCGFSPSALWCPVSEPTILLGFLLPWTWGVSSRLLQRSAAAAPYLGCGVALLLHHWNHHSCATEWSDSEVQMYKTLLTQLGKLNESWFYWFYEIIVNLVTLTLCRKMSLLGDICWRIKGLKDYGVWNLLWDVSSIITVAMIRKIDKYGQNINDCCLWVKVIWEQDFQNILNLIVLLNLDF